MRGDRNKRGLYFELIPWFMEHIAKIEGVKRIALIGSICTAKKDPKDIDIMVTIRPELDVKPLARLGTRLSGRASQFGGSAELFLAEGTQYLGRTCKYRDPFPRASCRPLRCYRDRPFLCYTNNNFVLTQELVTAPPLILWPEIIRNSKLPDDLEVLLGTLSHARKKHDRGVVT